MEKKLITFPKEQFELSFIVYLVRMSTLTHTIQPSKVIGGLAFSLFGLISVRVKYCKPTVDLGKVLMNSTISEHGQG
jgi:hypothetical protein